MNVDVYHGTFEIILKTFIIPRQNLRVFWAIPSAWIGSSIVPGIQYRIGH